VALAEQLNLPLLSADGRLDRAPGLRLEHCDDKAVAEVVALLTQSQHENRGCSDQGPPSTVIDQQENVEA
jgi:hypothetical protein